MTDEVLLTFRGTQMDLDEDLVTEIMTTARYYLKNNKHYLIYDEPVPEEGGQINNTVRIAEGQVDVIRRGNGVNVHMVYENGRSTTNMYQAGPGNFVMDIFTESIRTKITETQIEATVLYSFSINGSFISRSKVEIVAKAKAE